MAGKRTSSVWGTILYLRVLSKLSTHRKCTARELLEALRAEGEDVELRTIQRVLKDIVQSAYFPVECDDSSLPYGYRLKSTAPGFRIGALSPHEALLLQLAKEQLRYQLPQRLLTSMAGLFEDAHYHLHKHRRHPENEWLRKVRVVSPTQPLIPPKIGKDVFDVVSEALYLNRKIKVCYRNKEHARKHKVVSPLALVQQGVRLYLVCQFDGYDNYRHLALHRIEEATLSLDSFDYPEDFNLADYDKDGHFGFGEGKLVKLTMTVKHSLADDLRETPLSRGQKITPIDDETASVTATVVDSQMLYWWIRSYGDTILEYRIEPLEDLMD